MKKFLLTILLILLSVTCHAQEFDVPVEVRPSINKFKISDIIIHPITKQAKIYLLKGYVENGSFFSVDKRIVVIFRNVEDDPLTAEDETSTEYTDFIQAIKVNNVELKKQIKNKLGI